LGIVCLLDMCRLDKKKFVWDGFGWEKEGSGGGFQIS
jgi:hypothetical protein